MYLCERITKTLRNVTLLVAYWNKAHCYHSEPLLMWHGKPNGNMYKQKKSCIALMNRDSDTALSFLCRTI